MEEFGIVVRAGLAKIHVEHIPVLSWRMFLNLRVMTMRVCNENLGLLKRSSSFVGLGCCVLKLIPITLF